MAEFIAGQASQKESGFPKSIKKYSLKAAVGDFTMIMDKNITTPSTAKLQYYKLYRFEMKRPKSILRTQTLKIAKIEL